jgi:hypothetical protein
MALRIAPFIHGGSVFRSVIILLYLKSLKYCIHVLRDEYGYMIVGNYDLYREKLQRVDWDELINSGNSLDDLCIFPFIFTRDNIYSQAISVRLI